MEASFFQREKVLQFPGRRDLMEYIDPAEFVAEENLNYKEKEMSENEGVNKDDETIKKNIERTFHSCRRRATIRSSLLQAPELQSTSSRGRR
jgi:hypothetical protein